MGRSNRYLTRASRIKLLRDGSDIILRRLALAGDELRWIDPAACLLAIPRPDERRRKLPHLEMKVRPAFSIRVADRPDLFAAPDFLFRLSQDRIAVRVIRLHILALTVLFIRVQDDDHLAPAGSRFFGEENLAISHR